MPPFVGAFFRPGDRTRHRTCRHVGQAILPAAAFQAAFSGHARAFVRVKRRLEIRRQPRLAATNLALHEPYLFDVSVQYRVWT